MAPIIHPMNKFTPRDVVYCVYRDHTLVHIGKGNKGGSVRVFSSLAEISGKANEELRGKELEAWYTEVDEVNLAVPKIDCLNKATNLERLLQVAFYFQFGQLPEEDQLPGGKGAGPSRRGGFVHDQSELKKIFQLLDVFCAKSTRKIRRPWPDIGALQRETDAPDIGGSMEPGTWAKGGRGAPRNRLVFPAFWFETNPDRDKELHGCNFGWAPETKGVPELSSGLAKECVWHRLPNA